jgi:hypothetical protein
MKKSLMMRMISLAAAILARMRPRFRPTPGENGNEAFFSAWPD